MADACDGIRGGGAHCLGRLGALEWIPARHEEIRYPIPRDINLGPGRRGIRRTTIHIRNAGFFSHCTSYCRAVGYRNGSVSHRARSFMDSAAVGVVDRNVGSHPERNSWVVGNFCNDSVATGVSLSMASACPWLDAFFQWTDLRPMYACRGNHCRGNDSADHNFSLARDPAERAGFATRSCVRAGCNSLGGNPHRGIKLREERSVWRGDSWLGTCPRRNQDRKSVV